MPFGVNFGKNKGSQSGSYTGVDNFNQTSNFATSPTNPQWSEDLVRGVAGGATGLVGQDPHQYIAGPTPLLQTAANSAGDLNGMPWAYAGASDIARGLSQANAPGIAGYVPKFMDPYLKDVVSATSADLDRSDNLARQADTLADPSVFGSSGLALVKPELESALSRARATTLGGLRSQGYSQALGAATSQAQLEAQQRQQRLAAAQALAGFADQAQGAQRANIATQEAAAQPIQAINQSVAQAPLDFQSFLAQLAAGLPLGLFQGQTGTEDQVGTENQSGTTTGRTAGTTGGFGFQFGR